jgi:type I restriction enzyme S subunit
MLASNEGWKPSTLGEYFRIMHGYAFKGKFFAQEGQYVVLTPGNFNPDGGIKLKGEKEKYYTGDFPDEYLLQRGELLVVMTDLTQNAPILGSPAFVPDGDRFLHNQRLGKIVELDQSRMDKRFLYYLFNSHSVRAQIKASATGATVRHTAPSRIYDVEVDVPPLPPQRKIAAILSAYDDLIENNTRRIALLEQMAQALYREWFVHFRFPGHEDVPLVDSPLGPIPEGWQVKRLEDVCDLLIGQSPKSEFYNEEGKGLPFHQGVKDFGDLFPVTRVYCTDTRRIAESGDILFSVRAPVGRMNIADRRIVVGRGLHAIRSKTGNQSFVFWQLKEKFYEEDIMGGGTIFKAVTKADILGLELLIPPTETIARFEQVANPILAALEIFTAKNANLRRTRDLLLPRLISGQLDVSNLPIDTGGLDA